MDFDALFGKAMLVVEDLLLVEVAFDQDADFLAL